MVLFLDGIEPGDSICDNTGIGDHVTGFARDPDPFFLWDVGVAWCNSELFIKGEFAGEAIRRWSDDRFWIPILRGVTAGTPSVWPVTKVVKVMHTTFPGSELRRLIGQFCRCWRRRW